jgi:uncharacterized protein YwqG
LSHAYKKKDNDTYGGQDLKSSHTDAKSFSVFYFPRKWKETKTSDSFRKASEGSKCLSHGKLTEWG